MTGEQSKTRRRAAHQQPQASSNGDNMAIIACQQAAQRPPRPGQFEPQRTATDIRNVLKVTAGRPPAPTVPAASPSPAALPHQQKPCRNRSAAPTCSRPSRTPTGCTARTSTHSGETVGKINKPRAVACNMPRPLAGNRSILMHLVLPTALPSVHHYASHYRLQSTGLHMHRPNSLGKQSRASRTPFLAIINHYSSRQASGGCLLLLITPDGNHF